jgi:hypothetical protein
MGTSGIQNVAIRVGAVGAKTMNASGIGGDMASATVKTVMPDGSVRYGLDPAILGQWPVPRLDEVSAAWRARKDAALADPIVAAGIPEEYWDFYVGEVTLDGQYTSDELRRLADAVDRYTELMA